MEKKLNSFIVSVFAIIFLFFMLFPLLLCLGNLKKPRTLERTSESQSFLPEIQVDALREECVLPQSEDQGAKYLDKIIFLGESTTYGLWRYGILSDGKNTNQVWTGATYSNGKSQCTGTLSLSPSIDQTMIYFPQDGRPMTVAQAVRKSTPEYLVITLGLNNGASYYTEEQFKQCYRILLNSIIDASDQVEIILQSIFPVSKACKISAYTPDRIALCNSWIHDLAFEYDIKYLDTASALSDAEGYLDPEYDNGGDGIHMNEKGLTAVIKYIRTHAHPKEIQP